MMEKSVICEDVRRSGSRKGQGCHPPGSEHQSQAGKQVRQDGRDGILSDGLGQAQTGARYRPQHRKDLPGEQKRKIRQKIWQQSIHSYW